MENFSEQLKKRTKLFALEIIRLSQQVSYSQINGVLVKQITKSGTSVAANYRSACRGRSDAEFYSKICIVVEEADETIFWLELLQETEIVNEREISPLLKEADEILKIMVSIKNKTNAKL
jgi:four helix bundle protein